MDGLADVPAAGAAIVVVAAGAGAASGAVVVAGASAGVSGADCSRLPHALRARAKATAESTTAYFFMINSP